MLKHIKGYTAAFTDLSWTLLVAPKCFRYDVFVFTDVSLTNGDNCKVKISVIFSYN
jgi:hypothetical protein